MLFSKIAPCAILPDWHSTTFRRREKERLKALLTKSIAKEGRNILEFLFLKFRSEEEYFSEIRKTAILTEKNEKTEQRQKSPKTVA